MGALHAGGSGENISVQRKSVNTQHLLVVRLQAFDDAGDAEVVVAFSAVQGPAGKAHRGE